MHKILAFNTFFGHCNRLKFFFVMVQSIAEKQMGNVIGPSYA